MGSGALEGKAVIVTGGGTGIGRAAALEFAGEGARVLVVGRTEARLKEVAAEAPGIEAHVADVAEDGAAAGVMKAAVEAFGRVDVLVNNAAIIRPAQLGAIDRDAAERQFDTNLLGPLFLAQEALPHLERTGGAIVNITSMPAGRGWPNNTVYGAGKVALDFMTHTWAVELAPRGIRVVSVAPGATRTPVLEHAGLSPEQVQAVGEELVQHIPLARIAEPEEVAWWIVAAARPEAGYVTGSVIRVDGGIGIA
ncbi:SDR family NAD(P)-dependent oxidoreductase [Actinomadura litoris]|uniref:SDR family NAD(P)-dependent oxidoreductase n=1 Tax=Actinomadura litoris TaxID=2678616 RepID=UPI001FA7A0ED|nr:SDR family oxidoreductase [Actinomadura litoris]